MTTPRGYRPWLDAVRAFSILLVIVEHMPLAAKPDWNFGGTGVGVFFVLSGYLITGILLDEHERTGGIALKAFYLRRAARLIPALLLVVLVSDAVFLGFGWTREVIASLIALVYLTNYATLAAGHHLPGFGHTWSLAVEEHFYLLWPLVLIWMLRRPSLGFALRVTLLVCVADALWRLLLLQLDAPPRLSYVGSIERADTLLYGCAAAIAVRMGWQPGKWLFPAGVALIVLHLMVSKSYPWPGSLMLGLGGAAMLVSLDCADLPRLRRFFSWSPLVGLGAISYGVYLWHGTIFHTLGRLERHGGLDVAGALVLTLALSWLSYRYMEVPIREWAKAYKPKAPGRVTNDPAQAA